MDDMRISGRQYNAYQEGLPFGVLPGGHLSTSDWIQSLIMRGYGWSFNVGSFSTQTDTGITGGGNGTVMDADQPEYVISIPSGWACIPFSLRHAVRPGLQTTDSHVADILVAADRSARWAGDGTFTAATPWNLLTDRGAGGCPLACASAFTADATDPTAAAWVELARATALTDFQGTPADSIMRQLVLDYTPQRPPILCGPASIWGYWGGSIAVVGFAQLSFLAVPTTLFSGLS